MMKPDIVRAWCAQRVGCPYVYGATGQPCTPAYRKARAAQYPAYAAKIERNCPRLSGKAASCEGCRWADPETGSGKLAYDCAQLSRRAMERVGIPMVSGANSQWERTAFAAKGAISSLPRDQVALVFRWDEDHMGHVGVYLGDGTVIHAKGHDYGVVRQNIDDVMFTHWGIPAVLYDGKPAKPILRRGDSGQEVKALQALLEKAGQTLALDGQFGSGTEKAVKQLQKACGLIADGVCGPQTWAALEEVTGHVVDTTTQLGADADAASKPESGGDVPNKPDTVTISRDDWNAIQAAVAALHEAVKEYENER